MKISIDAYAKINLHLDVTEIRTDGYHNIQSIMQTLSLCDTVDIEIIEDDKIIIECDVAGVPLDEKNIAYKAAKRFFENAGIKSGAIINIHKRIPMAAGLAGGSADAAAVLVGLYKILGEIISQKELYAIGSSLGADIPFCISCGCCYTSGIGDKLVEVKELSSKTVFVIACGGEGVSTPIAYRMLDDKYGNFVNYEPENYNTLLQSIIAEKDDFYKYLFNIFEEPVSSVRENVGKAKALMLYNGAVASMMSGSGPSVFGVFENIQSANDAVNVLKEAGFFATVAYPTNKRIL